MNIGNRFHAVRRLGPLSGGLGPRMILERRRAQWPAALVPDGPEWVRLKSGLVVPAISGGAGGTYTQSYEIPAGVLFSFGGASATQTVLALDSNYVNATSGDAIAGRFTVPVAETLNTVYYFIASYTGTAANVNDINLELRNNSFTTGPSSTLHDSATHNPASATGWVSVGGFTFSCSASTPYWLVLGDADGNGTDFATVLRNVSAFGALTREGVRHAAFQTTDGWASVRTAATASSSLVLVFASGRVLGNPIAATAGTTSNTNRRGLRFIAPATAGLYGLMTSSSSANLSGCELWSGANGPSGSAEATGATPLYAPGVVTNNPAGYAFNPAAPITQGTVYRAVFTYGGATTIPNKHSIGTGADATLRSAMLGGGAWYFAGANGTTDWSNDDTSGLPVMDVLIDDVLPVGHARYQAGIL